ncbi:MAG: shikimate kinase [Gemmatimonadota bacterium]|nr:shikimate kinase [Gemmatimonadota bacterium]
MERVTDPPNSVWLVGLSGGGKSTVGPLLAARLGYDFVDLDEYVEEVEGTTVSELFAEGERRFREAEARASERLLTRPHLVVATGGGWMARHDIRREAAGCVRVWLRVSPVAAFDRLAGGAADRPLLAGRDGRARLLELAGAREAAYGEAEIIVDTDDLSPHQVADEVARGLIEAGWRPGRDEGS